SPGEKGHGNSPLPENLAETQRLGGVVGMGGVVGYEKGRNAFAVGLVVRHVGHGGKIEMFGGIVSEFLTMTEARLWLVMHPATGLGDFNDRGNVVGVPVDREASDEAAVVGASRPQIPL